MTPFFKSKIFLSKIFHLLMAFCTKTYTGNGTQTAFYDDKSVMYMSLHRYENGTFYPPGEDGGPHDCGEGDAEGTYVYTNIFLLLSPQMISHDQKLTYGDYL